MKSKCEEVEQITVFLDNRPGVLADLCGHLSDHRISIRAISVLDHTDTGGVRLVVDDPQLAKATLSAGGVAYQTTRCLAFEMPNTPGGFAGIARTMSLAGININYIYASASSDTTKALGIFHVSDPQRALSLDWSR
ncbi:MAG: ACT domain-containing protein [Planctomycetota bacterium]